MRLIRCFSFGKVSNSREQRLWNCTVMQILHCIRWSRAAKTGSVCMKRQIKSWQNFLNRHIDLQKKLCYNPTNLILQTDEAEITAMMPSQRAWGGGIQVRNTLSNGPLRAQSKAKFRILSGAYAEYSATLQADVICRGYSCILLRARLIPWIKVAPRIIF